MSNKITSKTIVFIHGLFMNPASWQQWVKHFENKGYKCYAHANPYHAGAVADLKKNIDPHLSKLTFGQVVDSLVKFIDNLPEKPILIGHSIGGLCVQKLINMDKGVAGICINSASPQGILSFKWSFIKSNISVINPFKGNSVFIADIDWFHYAFCNTMTLAQTQKEYDTYVVPESRNVPRSSTGKDGKIDFKKPHAPLLMIAGEKDNIIPPSLNVKNFNAYKDKNSTIDFKEFEGRTHYICGQEKWEEVADYIATWIINN
jgi:pimeloyl-ACP methyl ester carboxylesterase